MSIKKVLANLVILLLLSSNNAFAQDISVSADMFGTLPELSNLKLSPDGTKLLMFQNVNGEVMLVT